MFDLHKSLSMSSQGLATYLVKLAFLVCCFLLFKHTIIVTPMHRRITTMAATTMAATRPPAIGAPCTGGGTEKWIRNCQYIKTVPESSFCSMKYLDRLLLQKCNNNSILHSNCDEIVITALNMVIAHGSLVPWLELSVASSPSRSLILSGGEKAFLRHWKWWTRLVPIPRIPSSPNVFGWVTSYCIL